MNFHRRALALALVIGACSWGTRPALALDTVRAVKAANVAWTFTVLDIGMEAGIFQKYGITVDISAAGGDAKVQQALASDSADFGLGSGPSMAFTVKGAPQIAVAAFAGAPKNISILVGADSPIKTVQDLKGKTISVTTAGSLTEWLAQQMSIQEGWGQTGVKTAALGTFDASFAALEAHQIDGIVAATEAGYRLEEKHKGRNLIGLAKYAPDFITHVIYARKALVTEKPDLVKRFLQGFFATIHFMKENKAKTDEISGKVLDASPAVSEKTYDAEISMFRDDGTFDPKALEVLKKSWIAMGMLPTVPANDQIFSSAFVPVKY
ncbi:MAG TPA: ABC transporter substrate-binding protein [Stellaceae bacterium]|nr:ABC transporter substrate-binding protein [Stellaceae bacterium]